MDMAKENLDAAECEEAASQGEMLSEEEVLALIDGICRAYEPRKACEVTIHEMAQRWKCSEAAAANRMNRAVLRDEMARRYTVVDGRRRALYSVAK